jgi:hypothetical protein
MQIRIRRKDLLHVEVEAINGMLRDLERRVARLDDAAQRAAAALPGVERSSTVMDTPQGVELRRAIDDMRSALAEFRLHGAAEGTSSDAGEDETGRGGLAERGAEYRSEQGDGDGYEVTAEKAEV